MKSTKTIVITGNHHTPAIELIYLLQHDSRYHWNIHYVGHISPSDTHIVNTIIPRLKINFTNLQSGKFDRNSLFRTLKGIYQTIRAIFTAHRLIRQLQPDLIISFGGYVSCPVVFSGYLNHVPSITHEQTLTLSLATRINSLFSQKVALTFPLNHLPHYISSKTVITGNLLRHEIYSTTTKNFTSIIPLIKQKPLLYITGGNQGASFINQLTTKILDYLDQNYITIHQTGNLNHQDKVHSLSQKYHHYFPVNYVAAEDIGWVLNHCQYIISRSGANICQEINTLNIPAILIPLPTSQQQEQLKNAQWLQSQRSHQTIILPEVEATPTTIIESLKHLPPRRHNQTTFRHTPDQSQFLDLIHEIVG